ncbi:MAG: radical SAM protein [Thermodesulfovibrionales bacterium]|nr:radical SAM protein [Thermodesulfovibrionales bacterium]
MKILLINPWVHDFSCLNLWSAPLGLLRVAEYLSQFDVKVYFIDCLETVRKKSWGTGKYHRQEIEKPPILKNIPRKFCRYGISPEEFNKRLKEIPAPDMIFLSTLMTYWYTGVRETVNEIKKIFRNIPVIIGGLYSTLLPEHALQNTNADGIFTGSVENRLEAFLNTFGFRLKRIGISQPYWKLGLQKWDFAPLWTSEGCPFKCTYCASGILHSRFIQKDPGEVVKEILELYKLGIRDFAFYDDALLVKGDEHIKPMLKEIIKKGLDIRFHTPNGLHARFIDEEVADLMKNSGFKTVRVSLETISSETQEKTGGKVNTEEFKRAIEILKKTGFTKKELGVYLMFGLPGQGLQDVTEGVKFLKSLNVKIHLTEYSPIPETILWKEMVASGIISQDVDPLLTNNSVFYYLFSGYDIKKLEELKLEVKRYNEL